MDMMVMMMMGAIEMTDGVLDAQYWEQYVTFLLLSW
jgi:hypothetical protein